MRVWVDEDLCAGDSFCTDHCPDIFVLLDDGISDVRDAAEACPGDRVDFARALAALRFKLRADS